LKLWLKRLLKLLIVVFSCCFCKNIYVVVIYVIVQLVIITAVNVVVVATAVVVDGFNKIKWK